MNKAKFLSSENAQTSTGNKDMSIELFLVSPLTMTIDPINLCNLSVPLLLLWKIGKIIMSTSSIEVNIRQYIQNS